MLAKCFLLHMWVTRKGPSSQFVTLLRKSVINAAVPSAALTSMQRKAAIWVNTSSFSILPYGTSSTWPDTSYRTSFFFFWWMVLSFPCLSCSHCFLKMLKERDTRLLNREQMRWVSNKTERAFNDSESPHHTSRGERGVQLVTARAHPISRVAAGTPKFGWPDLACWWHPASPGQRLAPAGQEPWQRADGTGGGHVSKETPQKWRIPEGKDLKQQNSSSTFPFARENTDNNY